MIAINPATETPRRHVEVAIAVVYDAEGKVLICQRKADTVLGGYWEFPGGKCEPGETPAQCAIRELEEETGLIIAIEHPCPIIEHDYPHALVRLHPFLCRHVAGTLELREVAAAKWVPTTELPNYRFPEANAPLLQAIMAGKQPTI